MKMMIHVLKGTQRIYEDGEEGVYTDSFIGYIRLLSTQDEDDNQVLFLDDGQQRITTLSIFLVALGNFLRDVLKLKYTFKNMKLINGGALKYHNSHMEAVWSEFISTKKKPKLNKESNTVIKWFENRIHENYGQIWNVLIDNVALIQATFSKANSIVESQNILKIKLLSRIYIVLQKQDREEDNEMFHSMVRATKDLTEEDLLIAGWLKNKKDIDIKKIYEGNADIALEKLELVKTLNKRDTLRTVFKMSTLRYAEARKELFKDPVKDSRNLLMTVIKINDNTEGFEEFTSIMVEIINAAISKREQEVEKEFSDIYTNKLGKPLRNTSHKLNEILLYHYIQDGGYTQDILELYDKYYNISKFTVPKLLDLIEIIDTAPTRQSMLSDIKSYIS